MLPAGNLGVKNIKETNNMNIFNIHIIEGGKI